MSMKMGSAHGGRLLAAVIALALLAGCATSGSSRTRTTEYDKTKKGAAIGAASGAALAYILGEREADEILAGAAIGGGIGAGIGAYMDQQEEKLARIPGTSVERVGEDLLLVHFESDLLFEIDSAQLETDARLALNDAADVFLEFPKTAVIIQGHTDSTGSEEHNQALSERRAKAVRNYLLGRGIDDSRMLATGFGEHEPVATNDTAAGRRLNRRVDILLKAKAT